MTYTYLELLQKPDVWIGLLTLTALEIVLGIDNIVFISIISQKLPKDQQDKARKTGLMLAIVTRILFLLSIGLIMKLSGNLFYLRDVGAGASEALRDQWGISGRDLILIVGGLFLVGKATFEIHNKLEGEEHAPSAAGKKTNAFAATIIQILIVDLVFSIDSVITAVGMVPYVEVMIAAVIISVGFMLAFVGKLSAFVEKHPTVKMLALAFLVLIGANLMAEGFGQHIPKGYTYFAMAFSVGVEMLNLRMKKAKDPVHLRHNYPVDPAEEPTLPNA